MAFIIGPLAVLILCSFNASRLLEWPRGALSVKWYIDILGSRDWMVAFLTSLTLGSIVAAISTMIGSAVASYSLECRPIRKQSFRLFFLSPLAVPVISLALAMYICLVKIGLTDTFWGLASTHCVLCIPIAFAIISASLKRRGLPLEAAAQNLGASRIQTWFYITLPSIKNAIIATFLLCFATSFNEVVITIFMTDVNIETVSKQMWDGIRFEISPVLAVASVLTMFVAIPIIIAFNILFGISIERVDNRGIV